MRAIVKVCAVRTLALAVLFGGAGAGLAVLPSSSAAAPRGPTGKTRDQCIGILNTCNDNCEKFLLGDAQKFCKDSCFDDFEFCAPKRTSVGQLPAVAFFELTDRIIGSIEDLSKIRAQLNNLQNKMGDLQAACAPADLLPVPLPGSNPPDFCRGDGHGNLVLEVKNQGLTDAPASTLRLTFTTPSGPVPVNVPTPALPGGGGLIDLAVPIPAECFLNRTSTCQFQIAVDVADVVVESDKANNNASGVCVQIF